LLGKEKETKNNKGALFMDSMTQEAHHRQRMIRYAKKHGATKTAIRYGCGRKTVCKWLNRYESTIESLKNKSRRPHSSPGAQSEKEKKAVPNEYDKDKGGEKPVTYGKCKKGGYAGTYTTFLRTIRRQEKPKKTKRKVVVKEYEKAHYPGQKLRADVKYVPKKCAKDGEKYYRFTIIDEYTRLPFGEIYPDKSTLSSQLFLRKAVRFYSALGINVELIQTDNGTERTKALISKDGNDKTLFEIEALSLGINLKRTHCDPQT
jgi:hypothetical protein